jgi:glutathione-regulated potassium-efflux system ancillary protein KefG
MPLRTLVQFAHPALERSRVNRRLYAALQEHLGADATFNDLYEEYPSLSIDVDREKQLLLDHDLIVFQFPFYWYSVPSLLKEWMDLVLQHGWAYGEGGDELAEKRWLCAITTGGPEFTYAKGGRNRFTIRDFLSPLEQTAYLCRMHFLAPLTFHGALALSTDAEVAPFAATYCRGVDEARREDLEMAQLGKLQTMNAWLERETP